jgi:hypothetical protein
MYHCESCVPHDGELATVGRKTVSKDGKSMRVEVVDRQRGGTVTYTAEKLS